MSIFYCNKSVNTERETVGEWENPLYQAVRENRLTASNCGTVIKHRSTKPDNLVKTIMGINYAQSEAINYVKIKESVAFQRFAASRPQAKIQKSGIFIDETYGYLAASPDGNTTDPLGFWGIHNRYGLEFFMSKSIDVYLKEIIVQYKMNDHLTLSLLISILRRNFDSIISFLRTIL
ncbi:hypothetical protein NQ317_015329 [Molorchus minor]|uniref:Transposase n=1 Tax=Molorchus minor TaxID=1323400 RepID=A0ABQ9J256_9CUCU|nr:hypothetical protein NQ317_015329 [Molorchus minor]